MSAPDKSPRTRVEEAADLCSGSDHVYIEAIAHINELLSRVLGIIDKAVEKGTMSLEEHGFLGAQAGGEACSAIHGLLMLRDGDESMTEILRDIAKDMPKEGEVEP